MLQIVVQCISPYQKVLMNHFFGAEIDEIDSPLKSPNPRTFFLRGFFQQTLENAVPLKKFVFLRWMSAVSGVYNNGCPTTPKIGGLWREPGVWCGRFSRANLWK